MNVDKAPAPNPPMSQKRKFRGPYRCDGLLELQEVCAHFTKTGALPADGKVAEHLKVGTMTAFQGTSYNTLSMIALP